jgi:hypothetical protein
MTFIGHDLYYTGLTVLCDKFAVGGEGYQFYNWQCIDGKFKCNM